MVGRDSPIFYPTDQIPFRFFNVGVGVSTQRISEDFADLMYNPEQFDALINSVTGYLVENAGENTVAVGQDNDTETTASPVYQVSFHMGQRFTSENTLHHSRTTFRSTINFTDIPPYVFSAQLNLWEYAGGLRYNLGTGRLMPYLEGGYGWSWYRMENMSANGEVLEEAPNSPWVHKPGFFENLLPNMVHIGGGLEFVPVRNFGSVMGLDVSVFGEYKVFFHKLGLDDRNLPLEQLVQFGTTAETLPRDRWMVRPDLSAGLLVGF